MAPKSKRFFGESLLLGTKTAERLYSSVRDLPIIDYHCHLDEHAIAEERRFSSLGELWLTADHYKWRAMRLCGVDERYITGDASYDEKYRKYAEIFPSLCGNPLYYWTQMELKLLFGIEEPLSCATADSILKRANEQLAEMTVGDILRRFRVEYIATTDSPSSDLSAHGKYGGTTVAPTFRPDAVLAMDDDAIASLAKAARTDIRSLDDLKWALVDRLDHFVAHGCRISDHGMDRLPCCGCTDETAAELFRRRDSLAPCEKHMLFSHLLAFMAEKYKQRDVAMQLHFGTYRCVNTAMTARVGRDSGFDIMRAEVDTDRLVAFLDRLNSRGALPKTVLYSLSPDRIPAIATLSGAFPNVRVGAAWWFNDTVLGIRRQIDTIAEYSVLGTCLGMLTDSRSFSSYVRFDFFRRILADTVGGYVERGEYAESAAEELMHRICYSNPKSFFGI